MKSNIQKTTYKSCWAIAQQHERHFVLSLFYVYAVQSYRMKLRKHMKHRMIRVESWLKQTKKIEILYIKLGLKNKTLYNIQQA